jgi:hypothetical protein
MTEALLLASAISLLAVGAANLVVLRLTLRYAELAEARMERLHEDQARLLTFLLEDQARLLTFLLEERRHPEEERGREERERGSDARRDAGRRIDRLKRELLAPAPAGRYREGGRGGPALFPEGPFGEARETRGLPAEDASPAAEARRKSPRPAGFPETARKPTGAAPGVAPGDRGPLRGVWHPHPDDDVSPGGAPVDRAYGAGTSVEMFRRHYDKYLDNYEGYVKLVGRIRQMHDRAEAAPGSPAEHEWGERLRRVNDGIKRTTARLDILEEYNPGLATDDRVTRRASIAHAHSELEMSGGGGAGS